MLRSVRNFTLLLASLALLAGCEMDDQPRYSAYQKSKVFKNGASAREPVPHTESQHSYETSSERMERANSLSPKSANVAARQFLISCSPCHGDTGEGNGKVIQRGFPAPSPLGEARIGSQTVDEIYETIMHGKGDSPAYEGVLLPAETWSLSVYVKGLSVSAVKAKS